MIKWVLGIFFLFNFISNAEATRYAYTPNAKNTDAIRVTFKSEFNSEQNEEISLAITNYLNSKLAENDFPAIAETENYFPTGCYFWGEKMARYRPKKETSKAPLYLKVFLFKNHAYVRMTVCTKGAHGAHRASMSIPSDFPREAKNYKKCVFTDPKQVTEYVLCSLKFGLDVIVWGLTHPDEDKK